MHSSNPNDASEFQSFLENPDSLTAQSIETQLKIANNSETPRELLAVLVRSNIPQVAEAARLHVNWSDELTEDWQTAINTVFQTAQLGQNDRLAVELLKIAPVPPAFLSEWVPAKALIQGLSNSYLPIRYRLQLLERLAREPTLEPRLQVAESPETPLAVLEVLVGDIELLVRLAAKFNPNCPPALIELVEGQHSVAADWNTDAEQLSVLGQSRWAWVRLAVAKNPSAPVEVLERLADDGLYKIQLAVAKNPVTSETILSRLANHRDTVIQSAVAEHPNATEKILLRLLPSQRSQILRRQNLPSGVLQQLFEDAAQKSPKALEEILYLFLQQPYTPEVVLTALSQWDTDAIRADLLTSNKPFEVSKTIEDRISDRLNYLAQVACHPNVSLPILERLAQCPNPRVRLAVAQNPLTPNRLRCQLLEDLSTYPEQWIQVQVASNPNTPISVLAAMAQSEMYQPKLLREIRRTISSEYLPDAHSYKSTADHMMSFIKHKILTPAGLVVDVDRWMEIVESSDLLAAMADSSNSQDLQSSFWCDRLAFRCTDLLPGLDEQSLRRVAKNFCEILGMVNSNVKNDSSERAVGIALVGNPNTPTTLREQLKTQLSRPAERLDGYDSDCHLLLAIANNSSIPEAERRDCFEKLMTVQTGMFLLAQDPRTPVELLERLLNVGDLNLQEKIARNLATPDFLLRRMVDRSQDRIWRTIAEYTKAPVDVLLKILYEQPNNKVISNVSTTDIEVLNRLARDAEMVVRCAIAANSSTTDVILESLARDEKIEVRRAVAQNPNTPISVRDSLQTPTIPSTTHQISPTLRGLSRLYDAKTDDLTEILTEYAQSDNAFVRFVTLLHPLTSPEVLQQGAQSLF